MPKVKKKDQRWKRTDMSRYSWLFLVIFLLLAFLLVSLVVFYENNLTGAVISASSIENQALTDLSLISDSEISANPDTLITESVAVKTTSGQFETSGEQFSVQAVPTDGTGDGVLSVSNNFIIQNSAPTHSTPILNTTNPATNDTNQNLTAYNQSTADGDSDPVKNIYNWFKDGTSFASINLPFEGGSNATSTREYVNDNNVTVTDALWNSTGGYDGKGAYEFDGAGDQITVPSVYLNGSQNFSVFTWATTNKFDQYRTLFIKPGSFHILFANIDGGGISCRVTNTTGTINSVTTTTGVWTDSNWHFIGCQVYGNQSIEIYVDDVVVRTGTYAGPHNVTTSDITIGNNGGTDWNGSIDEVMFFNHSLSPQQVLALYNNRTDLIVSQETSKGEVWNVSITPNDGYEDGTTLTSNNVTILNAKPTHTTPILNSTDPTTNNTYQNLTAYNQSTVDIDGDSVKNIYNWLKDGSSIAVLNIPFEASANSFNATDYANYDNNATSLFGSPIYNQTGGYDGKGAYEFSTADEAVILATTNFPTIGEGNYTVMAWVKTKGTPTHNYQTIFSINNYDPGFYIGGGTSLLVYDSGGLYSNAGLSLNDDLWHHVAFVREGVVGGGNQLKFYMDGEPVGSNNHVTSISSADNLRIGYDGASTEDFEGTIDEFMFLNISLSAEQILALYNNRSDLIVSQETKIGDSWSVQITPNDGESDGTTLTSNSLVVQAAPDTTYPTFSSPSNTSVSFTRYQNFTANITINDETALDYYIFSTNASGTWTNISTVDISSTQYNASEQANISVAEESQVCWLYYANDTSGNMNNSDTYCFTVPLTIPSLIIISPTNNSQVLSVVNLTFITSDEGGVDSCWYSLDEGANITLASCANTTITPGGGIHNITFYVNDTSNNLNSSGLINFSVNYLPVIDSLILNATNPATNDTNQNLTVYNITSDADGDSVKVIYNWLVNGTSQLLFNVPFEVSADSFNATDYSGFGVDPSAFLGSPDFNSTGGHDGRGAYQFNGDQEGISFDASNFPAIGTGNYTFEAWVKTNDSATTWQTIWNMKSAGGTIMLGFYVYNVPGYSRVGFFSDGASKSYGVNNNLSDNNWHHVAIVREGTGDNKLKFYVDGVYYGSNTDGSSHSAPAAVYVGWDNAIYGGSYIYDFNGTIDEVRLWNRSLSSDQILALYNNQTDLIVSNETSVGNNWTVQGTPNDGKEDGVMVTSNQVLIQEVPNTAPEVTTPIITPTIAYTNSTLTTNTTYTDTEGSSGTVYFLWSVNGANVYNQTNSSITNGTTVIATLASGNFSKNNQVNVSVYASDGTDNSSTLNSTIITIQNLAPTHSIPILNSTDPTTNDTTQNLTAYNQSTADIDGDSIKNIYNWYKDGTSIAVLNMPFEANDGSESTTTKDYSSFGNDGTI
ncbi:MAG: LamG domain-containing protein, partial [Nanoarchaeota archaeon]|nr:LamG domain-containing protein [Nanoarchaeota archaeon]